jgi:hypothetical protein
MLNGEKLQSNRQIRLRLHRLLFSKTLGAMLLGHLRFLWFKLLWRVV